MHNSTYSKLNLQNGKWFKTNFHTHAGVCVKGDCGELPQNEVIQAYKKAKYDVLAISNHNMYMPLNEEYEGIEIIDAVEYSKSPHMLLIGTREYYDVPHQEAIDKAVESGGFVILCHPNWKTKDYWDFERLENTNGYTGIEILNPVIYTLEGSGLALDKWDYLLSKGKRVFGFGNDDFHQWRDIERSFNVIYAKSTSYEDIKQAVQEGCFYVSSGVALKNYKFENEVLHIEAGFFVKSYVENFEFKFTGKNGKLLYTCQGKEASYAIPKDELYVRVEVTAEHGAKMYLQPIFLNTEE